MYKHFFVVMCSVLYGIPAIAITRQIAKGIWTDSAHTTAATRCCNNDGTSCYFPNGTYYDKTGQFTENCGGCPSGQYDVGADACANPSENGTNATYASSAKTWTVAFSYGTITGSAACSGTEGSSFGATTTTSLSSSSSGRYCWCKITSEPSLWAYSTDCGWLFGSSDCDSNCAQYCAQDVRDESAIRIGLFGSVTPSGECKEIEEGESQCDASSGMYDIGFGSCVASSTNGSDYGYYDFYQYSGNTSTYGLTTKGSWGVTFSYGKVIGIASCNSTNGSSRGAVSDSYFNQTANGKYCWCKMTDPSSSKWVFEQSYSYADDCEEDCAYECGKYTKENAALRSGLYSSVSN